VIADKQTILRALRNWGLIWLAWTLYALFAASQTYLSRAYSQKISWKPAFLYSGLDAWIWAALTPLVFWLGSRFPIRGDNWRWTVPVQFVGGAMFALVHLATFVLLLPSIGYKTSSRLVQSIFMSGFHSDLLTCWVLVAIRHGMDYYDKYRARELRASQLEARLAQAQLQALKMQLQPHFLFNTLHAISTLVHRDPNGADRMISRLSDFLRLTLENAGIQEVPLRVELEFLDKYLEIEQVRFGSRLTVRHDVDPAALDLLVPNLILQPLVENAVRHGIAPRAAGGRIDIRARKVKDRLEIEIGDDGPGLAADHPLTEGVGLRNTRERLRQFFGTDHAFELKDGREGGFRVRLDVPARTAAEG
jgi:two-component system LytT family sensor kinase